jgi:hypothetical protein
LKNEKETQERQNRLHKHNKFSFGKFKNSIINEIILIYYFNKKKEPHCCGSKK